MIEPQLYERIFKAALEIYCEDPPPHWCAFFRQVFGRRGLIRRSFAIESPAGHIDPTDRPDSNFSGEIPNVDLEALSAFEASEEHRTLRLFLTGLREQSLFDTDEDTAVITIRLPKSLHRLLRREAREHETSMNKYAICKLLQPIAAELVPREPTARLTRQEMALPSDRESEAPAGGDDHIGLSGEDKIMDPPSAAYRAPEDPRWTDSPSEQSEIAPDQCPGGDGCTCCRPGCDCGCRDDCPVWRRASNL